MRYSSNIERLTIVILVFKCVALLTIQADDSAAAPPLDMAALASLASNLGSNPQIMSLMSNFLNPSGQKPGVGVAAGLQPDLGPDLDSNALSQENLNTAEPLRRGMKPVEQLQPVAAAAVQSAPAPVATASTSTSAVAPATNPLGGLMSMLPGVLSGLSQGGNGAGNLSLLGLNKAMTQAAATAQPQQSATTTTATSSEQQASGQATTSSSSSSAISTTSAAQSSTAASATPNSAQSVINQVLSAYAAGQIPNELIQLSLSGRVPPQIIELALSGQVPPQIIQMVITGQVPMTTINSFLGAIQQNPPTRASADSVSAAAASAKAASANPSSPNNNSVPGVFSTTRAIFETLYGMVRRAGQQQLQQAVGGGSPGDGRPGVTVPTLVGPVALRMPNVRSLGQLIGGSITNFSSLIPF